MRKSKKYQEIADSLNTVKVFLGLNGSYGEVTVRSEKPEQFIFNSIVMQLCYDFKKHNDRFNPSIFIKEVYK